MVEAEAKLRLCRKLCELAEASESVCLVQTTLLSLLLSEDWSQYFLRLLLLRLGLLESSLILNELVVDFDLISDLLVKGPFLCFLSLCLGLPLLLKLSRGVAAVDTLHLSILVDHEQDRWVGVHEEDLADFDLELPELDQVLRARELEEKETVLLRVLIFISRAHLDEELIFNG